MCRESKQEVTKVSSFVEIDRSTQSLQIFSRGGINVTFLLTSLRETCFAWPFILNENICSE